MSHKKAELQGGSELPAYESSKLVEGVGSRRIPL
jgi:hypothetical protein